MCPSPDQGVVDAAGSGARYISGRDPPVFHIGSGQLVTHLAADREILDAAQPRWRRTDAAPGETAVLSAGLRDRPWPGTAVPCAGRAAHPATATAASKPARPAIRPLSVIARILGSHSPAA